MSPGQRSRTALSTTIPANTYILTGVLTTVRSFSLTGTFPSPVGSFTVTGQLPTAGDTGSYSLTVSGQTLSGVFTSVNPTATPFGTPAPTATPLPAAEGLNLIYSQNANANNNIISKIPVALASANITGGVLTCIFEEGIGNSDPRHSLQFELRGAGPLKAGNTYAMTGDTKAEYFEIFDNNLQTRKWESTGGTIRILSVGTVSNSKSRITLSIVGGRFKASSGYPSTGTFQLDGSATISATVGANAG